MTDAKSDPQSRPPMSEVQSYGVDEHYFAVKPPERQDLCLLGDCEVTLWPRCLEDYAKTQQLHRAHRSVVAKTECHASALPCDDDRCRRRTCIQCGKPHCMLSKREVRHRTVMIACQSPYHYGLDRPSLTLLLRLRHGMQAEDTAFRLLILASAGDSVLWDESGSSFGLKSLGGMCTYVNVSSRTNAGSRFFRKAAGDKRVL